MELLYRKLAGAGIVKSMEAARKDAGRMLG
jgi:hypothetical protein